MVSAQLQVVPAQGSSDKADFSNIRPGTAIRTARHPQNDIFLLQSVFFQQWLDFTDQGGEVSLRFCKCEGTGAQCHTGHGIFPKG